MDNMQSNPGTGSSPAHAPMGNMGGMGGSEEKSAGALIGSIIVIVILIVGGLYLWNSKMQEQRMMEDGTMMDKGDTMMMEDPAMMEDTATADLEAQGSSDEVSDIEADLNTTNLEGLDAEMQQI